MQAQLNFTFDLGSAAGRAEFQRMFQHLLLPVPVELPSPSEIEEGVERILVQRRDPPPAEPAKAANPSSIPSDPDRAAAAKAGRQQAAAHARTAKANKAVPSSLTPDDEDLSGPSGTNGATGDQLVGGDDPDDMGLSDPSMSPGEAKEAGLVLVRQMYAAGKVAEVKGLQKKYGVAKFYDVPLERAHGFYREVLAISHKVMGAQA
jgi:hypothetical protein